MSLKPTPCLLVIDNACLVIYDVTWRVIYSIVIPSVYKPKNILRKPKSTPYFVKSVDIIIVLLLHASLHIRIFVTYIWLSSVSYSVGNTRD